MDPTKLRSKGDHVLSNYFLRSIMYHPYPMFLLGKKNPTKEMLETTAAVYYLRQAILHLLVSDSNKRCSDSQQILNDFLDNPNVICLIPGDGILPRTGYLLALRTEWKVLSIDPIMDMDRVKSELDPLDNLICIRDTSENVDLKQYLDEIEDPIFIMVHVHSHANFQEGWERIKSISPKGNRLALSIPCCKGYVHTLPDDDLLFVKIDDPELNELTPKSEIYIYSENFYKKMKTI
jgi:hypothetical protein